MIGGAMSRSVDKSLSFHVAKLGETNFFLKSVERASYFQVYLLNDEKPQ